MAKGKQAKGGGHKRTKQPHKQSRQQKKQQHPRIAASRRSNRLRRSTATHAFHGAKIEEYLEAHGLIRIPIVGDGNCLFRVMADQLGLGEEAHQEIRRKVVEAIRDDEAYFVNFIDSDEVDGVEAYCEEMSQNGVWGGDIELEAFRRVYGRAIVIYDASTGTPYVKPYNGDEGKSLSTVHLWKSDCHYESVRNKEGPFDGPSRVVYKDVKMSSEQIQRIKKQHEDAAAKEVLQAVPHVNIKEIQRLLREYGDTNKVVELLTGNQDPVNDEPQVDEREEPSVLLREPPALDSNDGGNGNEQEEETDALRMSIEVLSLDAKSTLPDTSEIKEQSPPREATPSPPPTPPSSHSNDPADPKSRGRQRRHISAARKEKQAKRMQKEAAKRRKKLESMGVNREEEEEEEEKHELRAIII